MIVVISVVDDDVSVVDDGVSVVDDGVSVVDDGVSVVDDCLSPPQPLSSNTTKTKTGDVLNMIYLLLI